MRKEIRKLDFIENLQLKQAEIIARNMNIPLKRASFLIQEIVYKKWDRYFKGIRLFPLVYETLKLLKEEGYKLGLLSDYPIQSKLEYLKIKDIWDCSTSSEVVNHLKPHPEPFRYIRRLLNVPFSDILYVGDRYSYDIIGAKGVGMMAAHFTKKKVKNSIADITFSDYREFYKLLTKKTI
jgi:putative hydrolase of the HAD superfamily